MKKILLLISSLICFIIAIVFWLYAIQFLSDKNQNLFWYSVLFSFVFSYSAKKLLKIRKELDIKIN